MKSQYTMPILIREDKLINDYTDFLKQTKTKLLYIHHLSILRKHVSVKPLQLSHILNTETFNLHDKSKICYNISGYNRYQVLNMNNNEKPYYIDMNINFSLHHKGYRQKHIANIHEHNKTVHIEKTHIDDDKKFVCSTQHINGVPKYNELYFKTVVPSLDTFDIMNKQENESENKNITNDNILYNGRKNEIHHLEPKVNIYVKGDFINNVNKKFDNVNCWLAYFDTYIDPHNALNTKSEKIDIPIYIPVGYIPDNYKECHTHNNESHYSCKGNKYIDGIDYSHARKLDFEISFIKLIY
jgi:hypothetical protein